MSFEGVESTLLEFIDNPFEDINVESSDITLKITGEPHEVTEEVDGEMQTFKCFPVEEISKKTKNATISKNLYLKRRLKL